VIEVKELGASDAAEWDAFVLACPQATFFHLAAWQQVIQTVFRHKTHYLYAVRDGAIVGVLPLAHQRSRLFGRALMSLPFCVYGGPAVSDPAAFEPLTKAAMELARKLRVDYLELRSREEVLADWPGKSLYVTFRKSIDADPDVNMQAVPRKQRAMIRKGIQEGLVSEIEPTVDDFYRLYSLSVRNLGTPVFPEQYFRFLKQTFGEACEILTIKKDGRPVAGVMSFYFRDEVLPYYGGGLPAARPLSGYDFMYWDLMRRAAERGTRIYDFGRSKKDTGPFKYKKHWGFEPAALPYQYFLVRAKDVPNLSPTNPKYHLFIETWKRMPLPLTRLVGPMVARYLG
jgi:FemAB-related protein (PEP-CTERM system-associated)